MATDGKIHGIFVWPKDTSERAFMYEHNYAKLIQAYEFPLEVETGLIDSPKYGKLFFRSRESRADEINDLKEKGVTVEVAGERDDSILSWFVPPTMFEDENTGLTDNLMAPWIATSFNGKKVFLFEDCFTESEEICAVPFYEDSPASYFSDNDGDYDYDDINAWPQYLITDEMKVAE